MFRERLKSSIIFILIINLVLMTSRLWFSNNYSDVSNVFSSYVQNISLVKKIFPPEERYSIPKKNLSLPRRFLINDGSLWMVYYNTDIGFSPIESRTSEILRGFLRGDINAVKKVNTTDWEAALESVSIYVEYPVSYSIDIFSQIMGLERKTTVSEISAVRSFVIIPSSDESDVCLFVKDSSEEDGIYAYMLSNKYNFPASDLAVYTSNSTDYYEPAFSTGLLLSGNGSVELSPLVLFSDSQPETDILSAESLLNEKNKKHILNIFSFNPSVSNTYENADGTQNFIENYSSLSFYPDSVIEYKSVNDSYGIELDTDGSAYSTLNKAIDFAEQIWDGISDAPFNLLITSDLAGFSSDNAFTFHFSYYYGGRPVEVALPEGNGHERMTSSVEITVKNGKIIAYRQYMKSYSTIGSQALGSDFLTALDSFVATIGKDDEKQTVTDIYIGYSDNGTVNALSACWIAKTAESSEIHTYVPETEVSQ